MLVVKPMLAKIQNLNPDYFAIVAPSILFIVFFANFNV